MSVLVTEFNQDNLQLITRIQFHFVKERIEGNSFLDMTRNYSFGRDRKATIIRIPDRYLLVSHYDSVKPEGGLNGVYKVDKELWAAFCAKFPELV